MQLKIAFLTEEFGSGTLVGEHLHLLTEFVCNDSYDAVAHHSRVKRFIHHHCIFQKKMGEKTLLKINKSRC